eukprot:scaffold252871_cov18-Tisochrysis_lutea.AAC.1
MTRPNAHVVVGKAFVSGPSLGVNAGNVGMQQRDSERDSPGELGEAEAGMWKRKTYGRAVGMKAKDKVAEATLHALRCTDAGTERKGCAPGRLSFCTSVDKEISSCVARIQRACAPGKLSSCVPHCGCCDGEGPDGVMRSDGS